MLVLKRKIGERIVIAKNIIIEVVTIKGNTATLGVDAPREIVVHRAEVAERIESENSEAATAPVQAPSIPRRFMPTALLPAAG